MSIEEIKTLKKESEDAILKIIRDLKEKTGLNVTLSVYGPYMGSKDEPTVIIGISIP